MRLKKILHLNNLLETDGTRWDLTWIWLNCAIETLFVTMNDNWWWLVTVINSHKQLLMIINECWLSSTIVIMWLWLMIIKDHYKQLLIIIINECGSSSTSVDWHQRELIVINKCWLSISLLLMTIDDCWWLLITIDDYWSLMMTIHDDWWQFMMDVCKYRQTKLVVKSDLKCLTQTQICMGCF